ncbi:hypothetical protein LSAT2_021597 [Lamellibrachia satsuma]|nr:hypothetical protein LSAT2_021597 [Lamellibrachia satsuma]
MVVRHYVYRGVPSVPMIRGVILTVGSSRLSCQINLSRYVNRTVDLPCGRIGESNVVMRYQTAGIRSTPNV